MEKCNKHCRYFQIAGITVRVESDLDFDTIQFKPEFTSFAVDGPGDDNVTLHHYFELPNRKSIEFGKELYHKPPWIISRNAERDTWYYRPIPHDSEYERHRVAMFNADHTHGVIYGPPGEVERIRTEGWESLSLLPTDQIWLAPILADRNAVLMHSAGVILNGQGLLFVGHSDAGKSTTVTLLKNAAVGAKGHSPLQVEILCDDRNIVRRWLPPQSATGEHPALPPPVAKEGEWRVHGTWSHGDVADVSSASASLRAILFLQQDTRNEILSLTNRKEIWKRLLATLIRSMVTAEWWQKEMNVLEQIVNEVPCYTMHFDKSGEIVGELLSVIGCQLSVTDNH